LTHLRLVYTPQRHIQRRFRIVTMWDQMVSRMPPPPSPRPPPPRPPFRRLIRRRWAVADNVAMTKIKSLALQLLLQFYFLFLFCHLRQHTGFISFKSRSLLILESSMRKKKNLVFYRPVHSKTYTDSYYYNYCQLVFNLFLPWPACPWALKKNYYIDLYILLTYLGRYRPI